MSTDHAESWTFHADTSVAGRARHHVAASLPDVERDLVEVALLLTSELVTNALRYGATDTIGLRLLVCPSQLRIEVTDEECSPPVERLPQQLDPSGRGLMLLGALAADWGWATTDREKTVWFTLGRRNLTSGPRPRR